jgi:hypothetical protein
VSDCRMSTCQIVRKHAPAPNLARPVPALSHSYAHRYTRPIGNRAPSGRGPHLREILPKRVADWLIEYNDKL